MKLDLVFNFDNGFVQHFGVALVSLCKNNPEHEITAHIINTGINPGNRELLDSLAGGLGAELFFYHVDPARLEGFPDKMGGHIRLDTYLRLFMTELLPASLDKVLYMDADLLVRKDLTPLWDTDIEGYALAAMQDAVCVDRDHGNIDFLPQDRYFNAGVMLVNLKYWREHDADAKFEKFLKEYSSRIYYHDQDVLNGVFRGNVKSIDLTWNMLSVYYALPSRVPEVYLQSWERLKEDPAVIHFAGIYKPWNSRKVPFFTEYYDYITDTPWNGFPKPRKHEKSFPSRIWKGIKGFWGH